MIILCLLSESLIGGLFLWIMYFNLKVMFGGENIIFEFDFDVLIVSGFVKIDD